MSTIYDAFLHHFNQEVPSFSFDGKFYRKDSLWSVGSEFVVKGNVYYFATFGDWKTGEKHTWSNYDPKAQSKHFLGKAKEAIDQVIAIQNFEAEKIDGFILSRDALSRWMNKLESMDLKEREAIKGLPPLRADVIVAGCVILFEFLEKIGLDQMEVSTKGVRFGLALE